MDSRSVRDFFDSEYRAYAMYTVENRAIPSVVDGLKPAQRKIAFAANKLWKSGNEKPMKVFQLGGQAAALSFFHHGSLDDTIIGMTQTFKNSLPIFEGIGQFGSLRAPEAGAPRYVGVKFNTNFRRLYADFDLTTPQYEEGEEIEPKYFLPIIPTVLLNGGSGIAVGFATNILNRHPLDLVDACTEFLQKGTITSTLKPWINGFHGEVKQTAERSWEFYGVFTTKNTSVVEITEIPPSYTYERYEAVLDGLVEKGILNGYDDASGERVRYTLRFPRVKLAELQEKEKLSDTLKMRETETENLTTLDENGALKVFENAQDLVRHFVTFRLTYYEKRKAHMLAEIGREIGILRAKAAFIDAVIQGKVVIANMSKADILAQIATLNVAQSEGGYEYLLQMPIYSLTKERYSELVSKAIPEKEKEQTKVTRTTPTEMYLADLADLRRQLVGKGKWEAPAPAEVAPPPKHTPAESFLRESIKPAPKPQDTRPPMDAGDIFDLFNEFES